MRPTADLTGVGAIRLRDHLTLSTEPDAKELDS
jgi:hypothetical protein